MVSFRSAAFAASLTLGLTSPLLAQTADAPERWSFTLTPRYQQLFFEPALGHSGIKSFPTYGGSIAVRTPDSRFGLMGTFLTGKKKNGTYTYQDSGFSGNYRFNAKREEFALSLEFTPAESGATLIAGYHHFKATENEVLLNPAPGDSEVNAYGNTIGAAEAGFRLSSRLGANSRQSLSAQFLVGVGRGRFKINAKEVNGGFTTTDVGNRKGTGYLGDIAIGYNIFLTDHLSLGARARGYVFYVDAEGSDPIFAAAPELNLSFRF